MANETIKIIEFEQVQTIAELRSNIKGLKTELEGLNIGTKEYADKLVELQTNQAALKSAMHDTTYEEEAQINAFDQTARAAQGLGDSYNALVRKMADLDQKFRTTEDDVERSKLGAQINEINDKLKEMDAQRGKFQRNVGNYRSALDGLAGGFQQVAQSAGGIPPQVNGVVTSLKNLSQSPVLGFLGLLAAAITAVAEGIKSSEDNTNSWNRALAAFKPIGDAVMRTLQDVGRAVANLANGFADLLIKWGLLDEEAARHRQNMQSQSDATRKLAREILVANAQLEAEVAEAREKATDKEKYTAKQRIGFLEAALDAEKKIAKNNTMLAERRLAEAKAAAALMENDADANDKLAQAQADLERVRTAAANSQRTIERQIQAIRRETAKVTQDTNKDIEDSDNEVTSNLAKNAEELEKILKDAETKREEYDRMMSAGMGDTLSSLDEQQAVFTDDLQTWLDTQLTAEFDAMMQEKDITQRRIDTYLQMAGAVSNIFGALADIYEANGEADEEAAGKAKALRTASAIVQTISGAVGAFMSTWTAPELPLTAKYVLAPLNASAVLAAGYAQVKAINSTKMGKSSGGVVQAPSVTTSVPQVRTITGQNEEERLNQMASNQRVYLVTSDVEAALSKRKVQVQETEF